MGSFTHNSTTQLSFFLFCHDLIKSHTFNFVLHLMFTYRMNYPSYKLSLRVQPEGKILSNTVLNTQNCQKADSQENLRGNVSVKSWRGYYGQ
jgi:hypothetical protein